MPASGIEAKKRQKGMVVMLVIVFMFLCFLAGGTYLVVVTNECRLMKKEIDSIKAFYLSQAGIEYGLWQIKKQNP